MEFEQIAKGVFETIQKQLLEVFTKENEGRRGLIYLDLRAPLNKMEIGDEMPVGFCYTAGNVNSQIFRRIPGGIRSAVISSKSYEDYMCVVAEGWDEMFSFFALRIK